MMPLGHVGIIVAARTGSTRLPGKALLSLGGTPMILFLLERLKSLKGGRVVLATTDLEDDDNLAGLVRAAGVPVFRGNATDLVARYTAAAAAFGFDTVGRVTGDCPFVDAPMVDFCLEQAAGFGGFDLATTKGAFPVGLDIELYPAPMMARLNAQDDLSAGHREHLTLYMYDHKDGFDVRQLQPPAGWSSTNRSFTVDTPADYEQAAVLAGQFARPDFAIQDLIERAAA
jgi:spore coat polysaccharide biosynthesis protein SpsF